MIRLILASQSPHRLQLLRDAGYEVTAVFSPEIEEPAIDTFPDVEVALVHIANLKARGVWKTCVRGLILAADTVGLVGGRTFGKPLDRDDARQMLEAISGKRHEALTGWCLLRTRDGLSLGGVERTIINMRPWSAAELSDYLDGGAWVGKSGAYGLRVPDDPFVTRIEGSAASVVGVPLEKLRALFAEFPSLGESG